jgi:hypothetical protein
MHARNRDGWTRQAEEPLAARGHRRPGERGHGDLDGSIAWAIQTLSDQAMPSEEIGAILSSDDPAVVRRYLELHRKRLEEGVAKQQRMLAFLEPLLVARSHAAGRHSQRRRASPFERVPQLPAAHLSVLPLVVITTVAAALTGGPERSSLARHGNRG